MKIDWGKDSLEFKQGEKVVKLQVRDEVARVKRCEGDINLDREKKKGSEVLLAHIFNLQGEELVTRNIHPALKGILEEYSDVFAEPINLPPKRGSDHSIPLLPNSKPVNLRPYRYSYF
jgi:hypothetical protein